MSNPKQIALSTTAPTQVLNLASSDLVKHKEVSNSISYYSPTISQALSIEDEIHSLPSDLNTVLYETKEVLTLRAPYIYKYLEKFDKVNFFDLVQTTGMISLPLTLQFLKGKNMGFYAPVTINNLLAQKGINVLAEISSLNDYQKIKAKRINADIEVHSFKNYTNQLLKEQQEELASSRKKLSTANIFVLLNSMLGNFLNPERVLVNVYNSMNTGDYFLIVQSLYQDNIENKIVDSYKNTFSDTFDIIKKLASRMISNADPNRDMIIKWDDSKDGGALKIQVKIDEPVKLSGVELNSGEIITLYRDTCFEDFRLKAMLKNVGFKTIEASYSSEENAVLILCQKS